jgi:hypothetical protein
VLRGAEAPLAALARRQFVHLDELDAGNWQDDELGDPHPRLDDERLAEVGVQQRDLQLAAVPGIDEARCVDDRDPVLGREAGARLDESGIAVGNRDREAGRDERALPRRELDAVAGRQVEPCVA